MSGYDDIIDDYLVHVERPDSWNNLFERPALKKLLPPLAGKHVLDLGCASGYYSDYTLSEGATVTAVDITRAWTDRLRERTNGRSLRVFTADISQPMPFVADETYDCIVASLVIHYLEDWNGLVREMYRVLKPGGEVFITTHHPSMTDRIFKPESFRDCYEVEDTWGVGDKAFKVRYFIRSLEATLKPFIESPFQLRKVCEPMPEESMKSTHPDIYEKLRTKPYFLFIVLRKQRSSC